MTIDRPPSVLERLRGRPIRRWVGSSSMPGEHRLVLLSRGEANGRRYGERLGNQNRRMISQRGFVRGYAFAGEALPDERGVFDRAGEPAGGVERPRERDHAVERHAPPG